MSIKLDNITVEELITVTTTGTVMDLSNEDIVKWARQFEEANGKYNTPCAIEAFCRDNPDVTSVCMTCTCPRCTNTCSTW